jgi:hypothetical protein
MRSESEPAVATPEQNKQLVRVSRAESVSGLPMFGEKFPDE